jgi:hypothetical protein
MQEDIDDIDDEFDFEACESEGTKIACHSVDTDGIGSCIHHIYLWKGKYWCLSSDCEPCGPFDSLGDAMGRSEFFLLNEGVWHEVSSPEVPHEEFVALLQQVQPEWTRPEEPMELEINDQRYVLTPAGALERLNPDPER